MKVLFGLATASLSSSVWAQEAKAAVNAPNPMLQLVPFAIIFGIFYFFMIRPQKKRLQDEQKMLSALAKGDEVVTKSGVFGVIAGLTDKVATLEIADGVKIKVLRSFLAGTSKKILEEAEGSSKKEEAAKK